MRDFETPEVLAKSVTGGGTRQFGIEHDLDSDRLNSQHAFNGLREYDKIPLLGSSYEHSKTETR